MKAIRAVVDQIVARWQPDKVILFGSHAYGTPTSESDVDLLIIMPVTGNRWQLTGEIRAGLRSIGFSLDLLVRTPSAVAAGGTLADIAVYHALHEGRVLYERPA